MPLVATSALILQSFPYGETSKILRLLTPEYGVRSVVAKGAQRPRSRYGGLLEPFTEGEARFVLKENRDLHTLSGFDLIRARQSLGASLAAFTGASLIAEIVLRSGTEEPQSRLYRAVVESLDELAAAAPGTAGSIALGGVWRVLVLLGFEPQLDACVGCGRPIDDLEATRFDVQAGGVACTRCRTHGRIIDPAARRQLEHMLRASPAADEALDVSLHRALLRAFLVAHLDSARPLRSLGLFAEQLR